MPNLEALSYFRVNTFSQNIRQCNRLQGGACSCLFTNSALEHPPWKFHIGFLVTLFVNPLFQKMIILDLKGQKIGVKYLFCLLLKLIYHPLDKKKRKMAEIKSNISLFKYQNMEEIKYLTKDTHSLK